MKWDNAKVKFILQKKDIKNVNDMHEILNNLLERIEALENKQHHQGKGADVQYGATSNCIECGRRIVFCGDGVWLHCEPQNHGHARPNGAIVNPSE